MSISEELVKNVLLTEFKCFDEAVINHAKARIIDVMGCLIAGANAASCLMIVDLVREWGGAEESTILVHGGKAPAHNVAMANSIMARLHDFEACQPYVDGKSMPGHISGSTVPTAIAVAEHKSASGKELIAALVLGDDVAARILAASDYSFDLGWDNTGTVNMFGATAIAGRLWRLDERQLLNAFGIVLNQLAGTFQNIYDRTHSFQLPQALAARAGIVSVELASRGFTGVKDFLLSKNGYFAQYCRTYQPEIVIKDIGKQFYADATFKLYPCCRTTHAAIDCALELIHNNDLNAEDIDKVVVNVTSASSSRGWRTFIGRPFEPGEAPLVNAVFSFAYNVANVLVRKGVRLEHFTEEFIHDPKVIDLAKRVKLRTELPPDRPQAASVSVKMKNGREFSEYVDIPKGGPISNPLTDAQIKEKFRTSVAFSKVVTRENAEKALSMLENLEEIDDIGRIIKLLIA